MLHNIGIRLPEKPLEVEKQPLHNGAFGTSMRSSKEQYTIG
jgi:hypothetical protein